MAARKVIITCAVTGGIHTPSMSPHLPVTAQQIADSAVGAAEAGAAIVHLHARNPLDGRPDQSSEAFEPILRSIKQRSNVVCNITPSFTAVETKTQASADLTKPATSAKPYPPRSAAVAAIERPTTSNAFEDGYTYGYRLWQAKFYREAQAALEETLATFPGDERASYARNLLGRAWLDDQKPATAVKVFYENYKTDPRGARAPDSLFFLGAALADLGKAVEACEAFSELAKSYPDEVTDRLADRLKSGNIRAKCK